MIKKFKCKETEKIFNRIRSSKLLAGIQKVALRKLNMIHAAISVNDLRIPPANHLERLKGNKKGSCSIRVNDQWRICFKWDKNDAYDVEIIDYH